MTFKHPFGKWPILLAMLVILPQTALSMDEPSSNAWKVRCDDKNEKCEIFQRYVIKETGQRIAEFAIGYPQSNQSAVGVVILPLGIKVNQPIQVKIDDQPHDQFNIESCSQDGCFASIDVDFNFINLLQGSNKISFTFSNLANQAINVEMTTKGFAKAFFKTIQKKKPE